jgi:hydroxyacylglutathione hydrolase
VESIRFDRSEILRFSSNRWTENCFVLVGEGAQSCTVVDPGYDNEAIVDEIAVRGLSVNAILATHAHFDHISSAALVQSRFGDPPFYSHPADEKTLKTARTYATLVGEGAFTLPGERRDLSGGDRLQVGPTEINVHHAPGHTPGSCIFEVGGALFTGDLLIQADAASNRRTGANQEALEASRIRVFDAFAAHTVVFPGHGRPTTLGELERRFFAGLRSKPQ